jgi:hypothetical protein
MSWRLKATTAEPGETDIARQRPGKSFLGNGYTSNTRWIVGDDIFYADRAEGL